MIFREDGKFNCLGPRCMLWWAIKSKSRHVEFPFLSHMQLWPLGDSVNKHICIQLKITVTCFLRSSPEPWCPTQISCFQISRVDFSLEKNKNLECFLKKNRIFWNHIPIWSMYGIFTYIYHKNHPNVGKYTIHWWCGIILLCFIQPRDFFFSRCFAIRKFGRWTPMEFEGCWIDPEVVDAKCKVLGLQGLRVADGSVIPEAVSGEVWWFMGNLRGRQTPPPKKIAGLIKGLLTSINQGLIIRAGYFLGGKRGIGSRGPLRLPWWGQLRGAFGVVRWVVGEEMGLL